MKASQQAGGYAALVQAAAFLLSPINFIVLLPSLGIDPTAIPDPAKILSVVNSPILYVGSLIQILLAATVVIIALTLYDRAGGNGSNRMRWAVAAAVIGSTLLLSAAMINVGSLRTLPGIPAEYQANLLLTARVIGDALLAAAFFAVGWSFVLAGWAALQHGGLPPSMSILVVLGGIAAILTFIIPALRPLTAIVNLLWSLWLGIMLLRQP